MSEGAVRRFTVDGEVFDVRSDGTGTGHHFDWVRGPNPGYGFSTGLSVNFVPAGEEGVERSDADATFYVRQIREFLAQIHPETGYIGD